MKTFFATITTLFIISFIANAQITIYDGETVIPDFWDIGGNPPNGVDCPLDAGWTLTNIGKSDILTEGLANPYLSGLNTTEKVVRTVRAVNGDGWAGAALDVSGLALNISTTNKFSILIYKEIEGNVTLKLEGAGSQEVTVYYNTPGQWQKLEFTFDAVNFSGSPTTLLVFPHNQTGLSETILTYWDEVSMYDSSDYPTVIYNGNEPVSGFFIDGYWGPNGSLNNLQTDLFPNLYKSDINSSNHVIRFLRAKDGESWCGMGLGGLNMDLTVTPVVSLMIYKSVAGRVGVKLEGNGSKEIYADYTTPGQWKRLTFTFSSSDFSGNPNTIIIFPHFEETNLNNLSAHTPMYVDNIILRSSATLATDYFHSTESGNWSDNSSWESSYNNSDWFAATAVPSSEAGSITIKNNHLITINSNENTSDITLSPSAKLTLNEGNSLIAQTLNIESDVNGTGTFVNKGTATIAISNIQQYITSGRNWYISSPVDGAESSTITSVTGNSLVSYNEVDGSWPAVGSTLNVGQGYIAVSPTSSSAITFSGALNSGDQSLTLYRTDSSVVKRGFNLVGNPYPAYLNWESAVRVNIDPTMWYRTKSEGNYTFATYGAVSKIGTSVDGIPVTADIPPMQGFWVRVKGAGSGTLSFNNTMTSHSGISNLLKAPSSKVSTQQVLRLQVSNGLYNDETIILFNPNASNGYDDYDSPKMSNNNDLIPEIYTKVENEKLVINGLNNWSENNVLPLIFNSGHQNTYTIKATQISNFGEDIKIQLKDKLLNTVCDLTNSEGYTFTSDSVINSNRFDIIFKNTSLSTGSSFTELSNQLFISIKNNQIIIQTPFELNNDCSITVYNLSGQILVSEKLHAKSTILKRTLLTGTYILKITSNGNPNYKKVILH